MDQASQAHIIQFQLTSIEILVLCAINNII